MAKHALRVYVTGMARWCWLHLAFRVMTKQAVLPPLQVVRDLFCLVPKVLRRLGPALRCVAVLAGGAKVAVARWFVTLGALVRQLLVAGVAVGACQFGVGAFEGDRVLESADLCVLKPVRGVAVPADVPKVGLAGRLVALGAVVGELLAAGVAAGARECRVGALEGDRVRERTQIHVLEAGRCVAVLAGVPEVGLAGRLVARGAVRRQLLTCDVAVGTGQRGVGALQDQRVFEITGVGLPKSIRAVAVLTLGAKVRYRDRLVAVGALRSGSLHAFVAVLTPQLGVPADQQLGMGEGSIPVGQELVAGPTILVLVRSVIAGDPRRADNARLVA